MQLEAEDLGGFGGRAAGVIGVVGSGTMGAGIAQLACKAGSRTLLYDPLYEALERGAGRVVLGLNKEASKGKLTAEQAREASERLEPVDRLEQMSSCELVIEAAPERLDIKHELYGSLSQIVSEECVLASNTSSLPITAVAAGASHPERVVGMHFFNPAPLMRLLEVIAGVLSSELALALADATGLAMGKDVIRAADVPGFIVNRCNRPFGLEALRVLQERIADVQTIDRIVRIGGGFRMGPFELSDLVGVDTGFDVSKSFYELSFGEPRWRPSPIQARQVAAGLHGRKTGKGYYDYANEGPYRPADPDPPKGGGDAIVSGYGPVADSLRALAQGRSGPRITVEGLGGTVDGEPFYAITPLKLVEVTGNAGETAFRGLGLHTERVQPAPGGVLGRIVCQVINESAFAFGEGVGSAEDIDKGMVLGLSHPCGPFAWLEQIGAQNVLGTLEALGDEYREERYRPAPALRRLAES
ncbi:MAG TPA: 3-hydroxyacyl-CoA dehydrogenase NAD-binding domain-containing protein [Solirubrobacteraceae bacterium]|nr:3-hydroxyacyl-CoA dehydrogenase NAD-binding domain-containing protein [Solirubrobacteraceae bacterium]